MTERKLLKCLRCDHEWLSKITPKHCAKCRSPYWDRPRTKGIKFITVLTDGMEDASELINRSV